jgi:hypothetical protein
MLDGARVMPSKKIMRFYDVVAGAPSLPSTKNQEDTVREIEPESDPCLQENRRKVCRIANLENC